MLQRTSLRVLRTSRAPFSTTALRAAITDNTIPANDPNPQKAHSPAYPTTNALATSSEGAFDKLLQESPDEAEERRVMQAPNRKGVWSRSQRPRAEAMVGPRFEQSIMEDQPRPYAAIDLIHKQPVRWTKSRTVSCDGGGGPLGHPRIFINTDKPQICWCTYCGVPYAQEKHRAYLKSLPHTDFPLEPTGDAGEVPLSQLRGPTSATEPLQSNTGEPLEQR